MKEHQDYKNDAKTATTRQLKANQVLQDATNHGLNQLMDTTRRDEEQITSLREQNACILAKVTTNNRYDADLKVVIRALQSALKALDDKENRPPQRAIDRHNSNNLRKPECYCYCWSHGCTGSIDCTNRNCTNPSTRHNKCAFIADSKGGSGRNSLCWQVGEGVENI